MYINMNSGAFWLMYLTPLLQYVFPVSSMDIMDKDILSKILNGEQIESSKEIVGSLNTTNADKGTMMQPKIRVKRQSTGGKYTEAAKMPQVKLLRLVLQMLRNTWADVYVGGAHPFHHEIPKPVVQLFRQKIVDFFFPDVGQEYKNK